ncbi:hypothetical protein ACFVIM_08450 [Streptomyces sp. NPDC057638]|uniref:hypothetical protein n=1 Tax=Streptomyces sp. NPDC057638 TaxID=3346190 RepID=UPI00368D163A
MDTDVTGNRATTSAGRRGFTHRAAFLTVVITTVAAVFCTTLAVDALGRRSTGGASVGAVAKPLPQGTWTATTPRAGTTAPAGSLDLARGCGPLFDWAVRQRAVPRGTASVSYAVTAPAGSGVVIQQIKVVRGETIGAPRGDDVGCAGRVGAHGETTPRQDTFNLDGGPRLKQVLRAVRPSGVATGVLHVETRTCRCEWWVELKAVVDDRVRTVRIDDDGRPFRIAPPVRPLATPVDDDLTGTPVPLSRAHGDPGVRNGIAVRGAALSPSLYAPGERWLMEMEREVDAAALIGGNLDVAGVACGRMARALVARGATPAGSAVLELRIAAPVDTVTLDAAIRVHEVRVPRRPRHHYACAGPSWNPPDRAEDRLESLVADRSAYLDTMHALGPFPSGSLKYDPGWKVQDAVGRTMPFAVDETLNLYAIGEGRFVTSVHGSIGAGRATYTFTIEVRVTTPAGEVQEFTVSNNGEPFRLAAAPVRSPPGATREYRETHEGGPRG